MKVALTSFLLDGTGYGEAARRTLTALGLAGADVTPGVILHDGLSQLPLASFGPEVAALLERKPAEMPDVHLMIAPASEFQNLRLPAKKQAGLTCWETDKLHPSFVAGCQVVDVVIVPSSLTANVFWQAGIRKVYNGKPRVHMVPFPAIDPPDVEPMTLLSPETFIFYSIFSWQPRKNPEGILVPYLTGFTGFDDVALILKISGGDAEYAAAGRKIDELVAALNRPNPPKVGILPGRGWSEKDIWRLHARGNCYFSMSRGESFGLPMLDAVRIGNPVIAPWWGGHVDFLPPFPALAGQGTAPGRELQVHGRMTPVVQRYPYFTGDQNWADPDVLHARGLLQKVFEHRPERKPHTGFNTLESVGAALLEALDG